MMARLEKQCDEIRNYTNWETLVHFTAELEALEEPVRDAVANAMLDALNRELRHQRAVAGDIG